MVRRARRGRARASGSRCSTAPGVSSCPIRVRCRLPRARRARARLQGLSDAARLDATRTAPRSGRACSTFATRFSARRSTTSARSPPEGCESPRITVVGSVNLDLVARVERLPRPGETVTARSFERVPGGKGANQAVAAARLGAGGDARRRGRRDPFADEALARAPRGRRRARAARVRRAHRRRADPGRRRGREPDRRRARRERASARSTCAADAVLCQLEIPTRRSLRREPAPASSASTPRPRGPVDVDARPDGRQPLTSSRRWRQPDGLIALTLGAEGAVLLEDGEEVARATPPPWTPSTAPPPATRSPPACSSRCSRAAPARRRSGGRARRALAASRFGAQPSLPTAGEPSTPILAQRERPRSSSTATLGTTTRSRCCSRSRARSSSCSAYTTYGNQTLEKTTANALRVSSSRPDGRPGRAGADRPLAARASRRRPRTRRERARRARSAAARLGPVANTRSIHRRAHRRPRSRSRSSPIGPLTNVAAPRPRTGRAGIGRIVLMGGAIAEGNMTPAAEFNIWADPEAAQRSSTRASPVTMIGLDVTHRALLTPAIRAAARTDGSGSFVADLVDFFTVYHERTYGWDGAPIHDAVALAHLIAGPARHDGTPQRRDRARVGAVPRAHRGRPLAADGTGSRTRTSESTLDRTRSSSCSSSGSRRWADETGLMPPGLGNVAAAAAGAAAFALER